MGAVNEPVFLLMALWTWLRWFMRAWANPGLVTLLTTSEA